MEFAVLLVSSSKRLGWVRAMPISLQIVMMGFASLYPSYGGRLQQKTRRAGRVFNLEFC
jgi:hypothetical protein